MNLTSSAQVDERKNPCAIALANRMVCRSSAVRSSTTRSSARNSLGRLSMGTSQDWEVAIEEGATTSARTLLATQSYTPLLTSSGPRDRWCEEHHGDAPPLPYDFGTADPYGY